VGRCVFQEIDMRRALLAAGILGGAIPVLAQQQPPVFEESLVVTATLEEEAAENLSVAVTVIPRAEIEARQATQVLELLATVPGLAVVQSGSAGKLASLFSRGANSNHTLLLWNGRELNDPSFGGFDWAHLATEGVERVEVVRGPFSALYGSDAIGGVVQVLTGREAGGRATFEAGGNGYLRGAFSAAAAAIGALQLDGAGHLRRGDGEVENDFFDSEELLARARLTPREGVEVGLVARGSRSEVGVPFDFSGSPSPRRRQERRSGEIVLPVRFESGAWSWEGQAGHTELDLEFGDPDDPFAASSTDARSTQARGVGTWRSPGATWIAAGADWKREQATTHSAFGPGLADHSQRTWAGFAQGAFGHGPWRFDLGARHDSNDAYGEETTLKAGALYRRREFLRLRATYGEGFHAPTLADLYFPGFSNPRLRPETSRSYELGLELGDWARRPWSLTLAGFATDFENLIQFDFLTFLPANVGRARSRGVEAEAAWRGERLTARLAATLLDTEDRSTGEPLRRRPEESASLVLAWRADPVGLHAVARHVGARADVDLGGRPVELSGHTTFELGGRWRAAPRLEPYARIENLLNEDYEEAADFPAPGRTLVGGVALTF
jgi:vitamin B12 transporter